MGLPSIRRPAGVLSMNTCTSASLFFSRCRMWDSGGGLVFSGAVPWSLVIVCMWKPGTPCFPWSGPTPHCGSRIVWYSIPLDRITTLCYGFWTARECIPLHSLRIRPRGLEASRSFGISVEPRTPGVCTFCLPRPARVRFWSALRGAGSCVCVFEKI